MKHRFVVATLGGVEQGEVLGASGKNYVPAPVGTIGTGKFTVPLEFEQADLLLGGDALLKVYQEGSEVPTGRRLAGHFRQITGEEAIDQNGKGSVATTWSDPFWVLLKRLIGKSKQGYSSGSALSLVDPTSIIIELLNTTNAESPTGLGLGTLVTSSGTYVAGWYYKVIAQAIAELTGSLGPDWRVRPQEYAAGVIGLLDVSAALGQLRPNAVFEKGIGLNNVATHRRVISLDQTANRVFHLPPGFPDSAQQDVLMAEDAASQAARGLLEDVVTADLSVDDLRTKLLAYHILVRKGPKTTISFQPTSDASKTLPVFGVDYNTGDVVPYRLASWIKGTLAKRLDTTVRVYQASFDVQPDGSAVPTLTVTP